MSTWVAGKKGARLVFAHPLTFVLLQIPETSVDIVGRAIPLAVGENKWLLALILFPYFCVASFISLATTYLAVNNLREGAGSALDRVFSRLKPKALPLLGTSVMTGLLVFMGFAAFILPGFYLMTLYLFVPILVLVRPPYAWSSYLHQSKILTQAHFKSLLCLTGVIIVVGLGIEFSIHVPDSFVDSWNAELIGLYAVKLCLSSAVGALAGVWISMYFDSITQEVKS